MDKIRIGNDISVTWKVNLSSASGDVTLEKEKLSLYLKTAYQTKEIKTFSLEDNVICFIFRGTDQKYTGTYSLVLKDDQEGTRFIILKEAFALVLRSEERGSIEGKDSSGNHVVKLSSEAVTVKGVSSDAGIMAKLAELDDRISDLGNSGIDTITPEEINQAWINNE